MLTPNPLLLQIQEAQRCRWAATSCRPLPQTALRFAVTAATPHAPQSPSRVSGRRLAGSQSWQNSQRAVWVAASRLHCISNYLPAAGGPIGMLKAVIEQYCLRRESRFRKKVVLRDWMLNANTRGWELWEQSSRESSIPVGRFGKRCWTEGTADTWQDGCYLK